MKNLDNELVEDNILDGFELPEGLDEKEVADAGKLFKKQMGNESTEEEKVPDNKVDNEPEVPTEGDVVTIVFESYDKMEWLDTLEWIKDTGLDKVSRRKLKGRIKRKYFKKVPKVD